MEVIGGPANFWLYSNKTGFDLTHPPTPDHPAIFPRILLKTTTDTVAIDPSNTALVVIDLVNYFLCPALGRPKDAVGMEVVKKLVQSTIPACRKAGIPVADAEQLEKEGGHRLLSSSAVPMPGDGYLPRDGPNPTPHEMTEEEIWACIADSAQAAKNAIAAGFDGVEIHGANGYLVDQFPQDTCNKRAGSWGGTIEARSRFTLEVATAVSAAIGPERVGFRISPWSSFQGMRMDDPVPTFSHLTRQLRSLGLGYLHVIESRVNNDVDCEASGDIDFILDMWGSDVPVLVAGGNKADNVFKSADQKCANRDVIFVFGRYFISNPDLPYRLKNHIGLDKYDRETFYKPESPEGYIDYPFSEGFAPGRTL